MMVRRLWACVVAATLAAGASVFAQAVEKMPAGSTAQCSDGTYSTAKTEKGACSKHGGVKTWFGAGGGTAAKEPAKETTKKEPAAKETKAPESKAPAKAAGAAPAGSTGQCVDGSYTRAKTEKGACSNHGGVKTWFATDLPAAAGAPTPNAPAPPAKSAPEPAAKTAPPPAAPVSATPAQPAPAPAAKAPAAEPKSPGKAPAAEPKSSGKAPIVAAPAGTPANAEAKCKDGTYSFAKVHTGACSRHGGVAEWYR